MYLIFKFVTSSFSKYVVELVDMPELQALHPSPLRVLCVLFIQVYTIIVRFYHLLSVTIRIRVTCLSMYVDLYLYNLYN